LLEAAAITEAQLGQLELRIPEAGAQRAWEVVYALMDDPALGLYAAEAMSQENTALFKYLAATSPTGREAYERSTRYLRIVGETMTYRLEIRGERTMCIAQPVISKRVPARVAADFAVGIMARLAPGIVGDIEGLEAWFRHAKPGYAAEYARIIPLPCCFEASDNGIAGSAATLDNPLPQADSILNRLLEEQASEALASLPEYSDFAGRVREAIAQSVRSGEMGTDATAKRVGMSARSLRRQLKEQNLSHQQLLDEVRAEIARRSLRSGLSPSEVAFMVGFSDASAFHKAFRRWTGLTPSEFVRHPGA
jgi:AraC-like DNA-binding protein